MLGRCYSAVMPKLIFGRFTWRRFFLQAAILLSVYVLSIGPMFWRWHVASHMANPSLSDSFILHFYGPLLWACEIGLVRDLVNAYIDLWIL